MTRAAIIGISGYGRTHLNQLLAARERGETKLVAAAVINQEEESEMCDRLRESGCAIFRNYDEMLHKHEGEIDLCIIPTGIPFHCPMTIEALKTGCNVLVEKPLAGTLEECDAIIDAEARSKGRFVAVGFQDTYSHEMHLLKEKIMKGDLGTIQRIEVVCLWPRPDGYYSRNEWAGKIRTAAGWVYDSPVNNAMAHFLMLPLWLLGRTLGQSAVIEHLSAKLERARTIESFDTFRLYLQTTAGVNIGFRGSHCSMESWGPVLQIEGSEGVALWNEDRSLIMKRKGEKLSLPAPRSTQAVEEMYRSVLDRVAGRKGFILSPLCAREHTRCVTMLHRDFEIATVDPAATCRHPEENGAYVVIKDLDEAMRNEFREALGGPLCTPPGEGAMRPDCL